MQKSSGSRRRRRRCLLSQLSPLLSLLLLGGCRGARIRYPDDEDAGITGARYIGPARLKPDKHAFALTYRVAVDPAASAAAAAESSSAVATTTNVRIDFKKGGLPDRIRANSERYRVVYHRDDPARVKKVKCVRGCPDDDGSGETLFDRQLESDGGGDDGDDDDEDDDDEKEYDDWDRWLELQGEDYDDREGDGLDVSQRTDDVGRGGGRSLRGRYSCEKCEQTVDIVCGVSATVACGVLGLLPGVGVGLAIACGTAGTVACSTTVDASAICDGNLCECDDGGNTRCTIGTKIGQCTECCGVFGQDECCPDGETLRPFPAGNTVDPSSNCCEGECESGDFGSGKCCGPNSCVGEDECCPDQCDPFEEECCSDSGGTCVPKGCCPCGSEVCPETDQCCPGYERCQDSDGYSCHYVPDFYETPACCGGSLYDESGASPVCCQTNSGSTLEPGPCCPGSMECADGCRSTTYMQQPECCGDEPYDTQGEYVCCGGNELLYRCCEDDQQFCGPHGGDCSGSGDCCEGHMRCGESCPSIVWADGRPVACCGETVYETTCKTTPLGYKIRDICTSSLEVKQAGCGSREHCPAADGTCPPE